MRQTKKILLLILMMIPVFTTVYAQKKVKIESDQIDTFTGERIIKTSWARIYRGNKMPYYIYARIIHYGSSTTLALKMTNGDVDAVDKDGELLMKDTDGKIHTLYASNYTLANIGDGSIGLVGSNGLGLSVVYKGDLSFLDKSLIREIRIMTTSTKYDVELSTKDQEKLSLLYKIMFDTINSK